MVIVVINVLEQKHSESWPFDFGFPAGFAELPKERYSSVFVSSSEQLILNPRP